MVEILAATLLTGPIQISMQCFMALGKPRLYSNIIAVRLVFLFVAMPVGFAAFGLRGGLWGIVLSYYSYLPIIIFYTMKNELFDMRKELLPLSATVLGLGTGKLFAVLVGSQ